MDRPRSARTTCPWIALVEEYALQMNADARAPQLDEHVTAAEAPRGNRGYVPALEQREDPDHR